MHKKDLRGTVGYAMRGNTKRACSALRQEQLAELPKINSQVPGAVRDIRSKASTSEAWLRRGAAASRASGGSGVAVRRFLLPWRCVMAGAG